LRRASLCGNGRHGVTVGGRTTTQTLCEPEDQEDVGRSRRYVIGRAPSADLFQPTRGWAITSTRGSGSKLRTSYGPRRPNSAHLNGQLWTSATSGSRSRTVEARSGGQGVASSNLASPTEKRTSAQPPSRCFELGLLLIDLSTICFSMLVHVAAAEIHISNRTRLRFWHNGAHRETTCCHVRQTPGVAQ